jgi:hypothetical protein
MAFCGGYVAFLAQNGRNKKHKTKTVVAPRGNLLAPARCQYPRACISPRRQSESSMHKHNRRAVLTALLGSVAGAVVLYRSPALAQPGSVQPVGAGEPGSVTAIDTLLDPDATMIQHAMAANERLRKSFPEGFALGKEHQPHISVLQRYVKTQDLNKIYDAVGKVLAGEKPTTWKLKAYKYYFIPWKNIGLAGIVIEPTDDLIRYQQKLIDAVTPFTVKTGTASAFVTTKEDPEINQPTIDYVADFVPNETGKKFNPHVTIGLASQDYLKKMLDEKFEAFTFSPIKASVYHLGNFGTARKLLNSWEL